MKHILRRYMWSEMLQLWRAGSLVVPPGVTVVFADSGGGIIQGLDSVRGGGRGRERATTVPRILL